MRSRSRSVLVALMAIFALSAVTASAAMAESEFEFSNAGRLKRASNTTQVLNLGGGRVLECSTDSVNGVAQLSAFHKLKLEFGYSGCRLKTKFMSLEFVFEATVSNAQYLFNAAQFVNLENTVTVSVPIAGCQITISPQSNLVPVAYENTPVHDLTFNMKMEKIKSAGNGGECGTGESTAGTYAGKTVVELEGGQIDWKK